MSTPVALTCASRRAAAPARASRRRRSTAMIWRGRDEHRAQDHREADAAAADHQHRRARLDRRGVEHRADAGRDGAADQRRDVERHAPVDRTAPGLGHDGLLGERAEPGHGVRPPRRRATAAGAPSPSRLFVRPRQLAQHVAAAQALRAGAAVRRPGQHHVVADLERRDARARPPRRRPRPRGRARSGTAAPTRPSRRGDRCGRRPRRPGARVPDPRPGRRVAAARSAGWSPPFHTAAVISGIPLSRSRAREHTISAGP